MKKYITTILIALLFPIVCFAGCTDGEGWSCEDSTTWVADDASCSCVSAAINAANNDAESSVTVKIPESMKTWGNERISYTISKDFKIQGAGSDKTIITDTATSYEEPFRLSVGPDYRLEICDIKMIDGGSTGAHYFLNIYGGTKELIIHDMIFDHNNKSRGAIYIGNWIAPDPNPLEGVMYDCSFINGNGSSTLTHVNIYGTNSWTEGTTWGTEHFFFIEDCSFTRTYGFADGVVDTHRGSKLVFRYNTIHNTGLVTHGNDSDTCAPHSMEVYGNTFTSDENMDDYGSVRPVHIRGGTALLWGNSYDAGFHTSFCLSNYRSCQDTGLQADRCDGTCEDDENQDGLQGYHCYQQTGTTGANNITHAPIIEWDNSHDGGTNNMGFIINTGCENPSMADHLKEERDWISYGMNTCGDSNDDDGDGDTDMSDSDCSTFWDATNNKAKNYVPYGVYANGRYYHPLRYTDTTPPDFTDFDPKNYQSISYTSTQRIKAFTNENATVRFGIIGVGGVTVNTTYANLPYQCTQTGGPESWYDLPVSAGTYGIKWEAKDGSDNISFSIAHVSYFIIQEEEEPPPPEETMANIELGVGVEIH